MSANGHLKFQGTNRATFVGGTSNIMFDTTSTSLGIGVTGTDHPSSNLYITGNAYVSSNIAVGGVLTMGTVNVVARHDLEAVTAMGNTTPLTIEFSNATTGIVTTGNVEVGGELTVSGNVSDLNVVSNVNMLHTANTASIKLNSNVVTEFPRSKKLIKYPRVAMTSGQSGLNAGYTQDGYTIQVSSEWGGVHMASNAFNNIQTYQTTDHAWLSSNNPDRYTPSTGMATTADTFQDVNGSWIGLTLPEKIKLSSVHLYNRRDTSSVRPARKGIVWGSDGGSTWYRLKDFTNGSMDGALNVITVESDILYDRFRVQITEIHNDPQKDAVAIGELEFYGVPEYDPEAHGTNVTLKSVPNVPNTDWLKVYYDAKDLQDTTSISSITGLGGTTNNGTPYGNLQISDGAFDFDGTGDYIITAPIGFTGDQLHSVSLWFWSDKPQTDMTTEHGIYGFGYANNNRGGLSWWSPVTQPNSSLRFWHSGSGGKNFPGTTFLEDMWNHVVLVYPGDGADNTRIWLNGTELTGVQNTSVNNDFNWSASDTIVIGDWYTSTGVRAQSPWDGKIANFRLFNRVITSDEIYQLYAYQKEDFGHSTNNMTLKAGRLGIGTSEPRAALDVRGRIAREYNPGEIIEELNAICDGSTVTVQSGSYTMANITAYQTGSTSYQVITGSTINYTPPPGTKRVYYRFWFKWDAYRNQSRSHFQFQIDDVVVTPSKNSISSASGSDHQAAFPVSVEYTIDCNASTDDASNGKFKSWTGPKELECTFRDYSHPDDRCLIHVNEWTDGTGNDSIQKPHLTVRAIA